jgi:hypothetical protein
MNTVTIFTNKEDAEKLAVILLRSENTFHVELYEGEDGSGFLFTISEEIDYSEI